MIASLDTSLQSTHPDYDWWVFSTALSEGWLMLYCPKTGKTGSVRNPSKTEWAKAFDAPNNPYQWHDNSRVVIDVK
jgi:hypothetical protein